MDDAWEDITWTAHPPANSPYAGQGYFLIDRWLDRYCFVARRYSDGHTFTASRKSWGVVGRTKMVVTFRKQTLRERMVTWAKRKLGLLYGAPWRAV